MSDDQVRPLLPAISATQLRANPFRVLGLAADASAAQVRRQAERVAAAHRLGAAQAAPGVLPPATAPDEAALREAAHRLRDPQARLLSELLWFSPDPGPDPPAGRWTAPYRSPSCSRPGRRPRGPPPPPRPRGPPPTTSRCCP
jgi:hypothetical protein